MTKTYQQCLEDCERMAVTLLARKEKQMNEPLEAVVIEHPTQEDLDNALKEANERLLAPNALERVQPKQKKQHASEE